MKQLFTFFIVIILITGCNQTPPEIHQVEMGFYTPYFLFAETLNGKVKTIIEKSYMGVEKDGKYVKDIPLTVKARDSINWTTDFMLTYDEHGNLLYSVDIDENDKAINSWEISYQDHKMVKCELSSSDTLRVVAKLSYNEAGVLTMIQHFRMPVDTIAFQAVITSDENGNFTEWQFQNPAGENTGKYMFTVGLEGKRTGYTYFNKDGEQTFEQQYTYNENGDMIKQLLIDKERKKSVSEFEYEGFDEMGNWLLCSGNADEYMIITERTITYHEE